MKAWHSDPAFCKFVFDRIDRCNNISTSACSRLRYSCSFHFLCSFSRLLPQNTSSFVENKSIVTLFCWDVQYSFQATISLLHRQFCLSALLCTLTLPGCLSLLVPPVSYVMLELRSVRCLCALHSSLWPVRSAHLAWNGSCGAGCQYFLDLVANHNVIL